MKLKEVDNIPDLHYRAINYVFEENLVIDSGLWLEFGVYTGGSIRRIARRTSRKCVFGFDSFEGLPEPWEYRPDYTFVKGSFNLNGKPPKVPDNVTLIKGWYIDTIPQFTIDYKEPITFIHIDSDIYSSAKEILTGLNSRICNGCIIVFDEMVAYHGFERHEWKAWWEFVEANNITFEWIGGNKSKIIHSRKPEVIFEFDNPHRTMLSPTWENVAVKIINNPSFKISQ